MKKALGIIIGIIIVVLIVVLVGRSRTDAPVVDTDQAPIGDVARVALPDGQYSLNQSESSFVWSGAKVGGTHEGEVNGDGVLLVEKSRVVNGAVSVDMTSLTSTDITDPKQNKQLVDDLKGEKFFDVAQYPVATFVLRDIVVGEDDMPYVSGVLTIKGVDKELFVPVTVVPGTDNILISGTLDLERSEFGINPGVPLNSVVNQEFSIDFALTFLKK